jgi:hypothetical protein
MPQLYVILPVGGGGQIDNSLPGGQGGSPSQPIYHPGHPDHGLPAFPSQGLPGQGGGRPDQGLPPFPSQGLPEGGTDIPSNELPLPQPPAEYQDDLVVAVRKPHETEWVVKAYDPALQPDQGGPQPTPHKRRR